jgi:peroxiredoxin
VLKEGSRAPDFTLDQVDDGPVRLSEVLSSGSHVLLIFLRHLS